MKKRIQGFVLGVLCCMILMSCVYASENNKMIEVVENKINITINGVSKKMPNILYKGIAYVPIRAISTFLDKTITWDEKSKTAIIEDAKAIDWTDRDMHFARVYFGDKLYKIKYRVGEPDGIIKNKDGSIIYKCIIPPVEKYSIPYKDGNVEYLGEAESEQTVLFYTNGSEQKKRENLSGVYKVDVLNGCSEMIGKDYDADGTYNGLLKTYGIPYKKVLLEDGESEKIWYQLPSNKTRYLYFVIKDGDIISHGMEIKY